MAFISIHAKLQLPSSTIVNVTADGVISRIGLMLPPYEVWCSAREGSLSCCVNHTVILAKSYFVHNFLLLSTENIFFAQLWTVLR